MKTIGITGATGFLGTYLLNYLQSRGGCQIRALRRTLKSDSQRRSAGVTWQQGDLLSRADCLDFAAGVDVIIHLAHTNTVLASDRDPPGDAAANLIPTLNLLEGIKQSGKKAHVIYASSGGAVYGSSSRQIPFREDDPCCPMSAYGIQKLTAEHYLRLAASQGHLTGVVLRISNPYGVLLPAERMQGFIGVALQRIQRGEAIRLFSPRETVRDYLHIDDLCRAIEIAMSCGRSFSTINLGSGQGHSLTQVIAAIEEHVGEFDIHEDVTQHYAKALPPWNVLDVSKASDELRWVPQIGLREGIARLVSQSLTPTGAGAAERRQAA